MSPAYAAPGDTHTVVFAFTGAPETFSVPVNADELIIEMWGGNGGSSELFGANGTGGVGSHVSFTVPVAELGSTLEVRVGGNGGDVSSNPWAADPGAAGGWNGGGAGGNGGDGQPGAGGGGATDLRDAGTRIAVAGGGGGAGGQNEHPLGSNHGGAGGSVVGATTANGADGAPALQGAAGGSGATALAPGGGANPGVGENGGPGGSSTGLSDHSAGAGGGGGGLFGGAGGAARFESSGGGGGGGASSVPTTATDVAFGASALSSGQVRITWTEVDVVPAAPTDLQVIAGDGQLTLSWTPPAANGGSAVTSYTVTLSPGGATCTTPTTSCTITGLSNDVSYTATVVASNALGAGAPSGGVPAVARAQNPPPAEPASPTPAPLVAVEQETLAFTGLTPGFLGAIGLLLLVIGLGMNRVRIAFTGS